MQTHTQDQAAATLGFFGPRPTTHETSCISIIWLKDRFPRHLKNAFLIEVQKNQGVRSARFSLKEPSLLIVTYDVTLTKPLDILITVKALGAEARLVGC
jgi:hypothetical protein